MNRSKIGYERARNRTPARAVVRCAPRLWTQSDAIRVVCDTKADRKLGVVDWGYAVSTGLVYLYKRSRIFAYYGALGRVAVVHLLYAFGVCGVPPTVYPQVVEKSP